MRILMYSVLFLFSLLLFSCDQSESVYIEVVGESSRIDFGADRLAGKLQQQGYLVQTEITKSQSKKILIGEISNPLIIAKIDTSHHQLTKKESYCILTTEHEIIIAGYDASGALYGCLELADKIKENGLNADFTICDSPEMVLRGTAIGLQKPDILPGREVYEYPITPNNFPWFYNRELWLKYLDMMVDNRMNSLYLWNGHPFASLVKLNDYPYAVEVNDNTFQQNKEIYAFLTEEADKRGIWVIQMFYNIILSKPFAEHHQMETQERSRPITPLIEDYTRKSIAAFIENYPHVGLMVCLGEAMNTIEDDITWFTNTIIPGVEDGLKALGTTEKPPIVLRGHDTDAKRVMAKALPIYHNLYTTYKYNGESLTTYEPRADWVNNNRALSSLGSVHISNVHVLANLEPWRYGSPDFIQKSTLAMHRNYAANGLHLYPQASYWDWPYTADKTNDRLLQIDRDWIWYKAWARYAWKADRSRETEIDYWSAELGQYYGNTKAGKYILEAYEQSGEIAPKLARTFGITDGNRQSLLLGMFMSQLVNPSKWRVYESFINSNGPKGERLPAYAKNEFNGTPHEGELPTQIINEVFQHGQRAKEAIDLAAKHIAENTEEFSRLQNDIYCYDAFARFFQNKVKAALLVLNYKHSGNLADLEAAVPYLEASVNNYSELVKLTKDTYLYANSMQTRMRRIPIDGTEGVMKTWEELLPLYQQELTNFKNNIERLKSANGSPQSIAQEKLKPANVKILSKGIKQTKLQKGAKPYSDQDFSIQETSDVLTNLDMVQLNYNEQIEKGTTIEFRNENPVKIIVGYFNGHSYRILSPPTLETNASANDRGQADIRIANALLVNGLYPVNIYTYYYEPGEHTLTLNKGIALVLGFINGDQEIKIFDAGIGGDGTKPIDWLFY